MQLVLTEYACFAETYPDFPVVSDEPDLKNLPHWCSETDVRRFLRVWKNSSNVILK